MPPGSRAGAGALELQPDTWQSACSLGDGRKEVSAGRPGIMREASLQIDPAELTVPSRRLNLAIHLGAHEKSISISARQRRQTHIVRIYWRIRIGGMSLSTDDAVQTSAR